MNTTTLYERLNTLNAAYAHCIDEDKLESWPGFFSAHCLYKITTAENYDNNLPAGLVYADSQNMLKDRVSALRKANVYERQRYRHIIGTPFITQQTPALAKAETPFLVTRIMRGGKMDLFVTGKYIDEVAITDDATTLEKRIVVCDSISFDTLVAIPL